MNETIVHEKTVQADWVIKTSGARFSKAPESFRARKDNFKSPQLKNQKDSYIRNAA